MTPEGDPSPLPPGGYRCAVLGSPVAHSLSPALHTAAYAALGLSNWRYDTCEVDQAGLAGFLAGCGEGWRGLSLTMPLKVAVLGLGTPSPVAAQIGVANTLLFEPDGWRLDNTDVTGVLEAVRRAGLAHLERVTLLGAGATARSVLAALAQLGGPTVTVLARDLSRAAGLVALGAAFGLTVKLQAWSADPPAGDLLVSTVIAAATADRAELLAACAPVVFDVVYDPWPTPLARAAAAGGATVVSGLDLLVGQARGQVALMTGRPVPAEVLYAAGRAELAARATETRERRGPRRRG